MSNLHFVYAGSPENNNTNAPYTITKNLYAHLKPLFNEIYYYDWCHTGQVHPVGENDIILGHPNYPQNTATRQLFKYKAKLKCLIHPLHNVMVHCNWPFDDLAKEADIIFSIMGPYWYDTLESSIFAHWKPKITRLDIAINQNDFPFNKTTFNQPGTRSFAYIGSDIPEKGINILCDIFKLVPYTLHMYGNINNPIIHLPNVHYHGYTHITPQFCKDLCNTVDFFISTSISDANPTTLSEISSMGLVGLCTQSSGYWPNKPFIGLDINNFDSMVNTVHHAQQMPENELIMQSTKQQEWVKNNCNWERFCTTVSNRLL